MDLTPAELALIKTYRASQQKRLEYNIDRFLGAWGIVFAMLLAVMFREIVTGRIVLP